MISYEFLRPRGDGKRYLSAPVPKKVKHHGKPSRVSIEAGKGNQATMEPYRFWSHISICEGFLSKIGGLENTS